MNRPCEVVVISADLENRHTIAETLARLEVDSICISTVGQYREVAENEIKLVFCDVHLPDGDYRDVVAATGSAKKAPNVVIMAKQLNSDNYHQAKLSGIFEAIPTPCRPTDIEWMVILAKKQHRSQALAALQSAR